mmetsp:Transcript_19919/g.49569  ORF Transcript_19919/g.49569 Transcript_19919/m.49569 type:complete len:96 (-) Transcript_19919:90-377(-)
MGPPSDDDKLGKEVTISLLPFSISYLARGRIRATTRTFPEASAAFGAPIFQLFFFVFDENPIQFKSIQNPDKCLEYYFFGVISLPPILGSDVNAL